MVWASGSVGRQRLARGGATVIVVIVWCFPCTGTVLSAWLLSRLIREAQRATASPSHGGRAFWTRMLMTIVVGLTCGLCLDRSGGQQMADSAAIVTLIVGLGAGTAYQVLDRDDAVDRVLLCLTVMGAVILMLGGTAITGTLASAWVLWVWTVGFIYGIVVAETVLRRRDRREHEVQAMVVKTARHG